MNADLGKAFDEEVFRCFCRTWSIARPNARILPMKVQIPEALQMALEVERGWSTPHPTKLDGRPIPLSWCGCRAAGRVPHRLP